MSKTVKFALIGLVVLVGFIFLAKSQGWIGSKEGVKVETQNSELKTIVETVIASGKIQPEVEVKISPEVSGEIIELPVKEGSQVKKGDLLVKINPDLFVAAVNRSKASVNSAKAAVASSKAQLLETEKIYNRNKTLKDQQVISDAEYDAAKRAYDVAKLNVSSSEFQLESAYATLKEAQDNLRRTTIYAPQEGTISKLNSELGERVVGTAQMAGTEIMRIANLNYMEVLVEVNENDIIRVKLNDTALIEVDAYLDKEFKGIVTEIANSANLNGQSIDQVTNFDVKVRILASSYQELLEGDELTPFRPGMTASLEILTNKKENVICVPIQAVTTRTDTSDTPAYKQSKSNDDDDVFEIVFVLNEGKAQTRVVKTGVQDDKDIEIITGLKEGEQVITGPYSLVSKTLKNGDEVSAEDTAETKKEKDKEESDS